MSEIVLPGVSLCAIVRDEIMNPAGGIVDFIDSTMPYLEAGVVVDTGSIDGTRQALEELKTRYPNLAVLYRGFDGFASSRNYSLRQVQMPYAFVLDADERLTKEDFKFLRLVMEDNNALGYSFGFIVVFPNREEEGIDGLNPRLFRTGKRIRYVNDVQERLHRRNGPVGRKYMVPAGIDIKHIRAEERTRELKDLRWYQPLIRWVDSGKQDPCPVQSQSLDFESWKTYNPRREKYR